jgi:RES domain-containing protein
MLSDEDPLPPYLMLTIEYDIPRLLDLTDEKNLNEIAATPADLVQRIPLFSKGSAPTQLLGVAATAAGFQGLVVPSRPDSSGANLVIFADAVNTGDYAVYYDPPGRFEAFDPIPGSNVIKLRRGVRTDG